MMTLRKKVDGRSNSIFVCLGMMIFSITLALTNAFDPSLVTSYLIKELCIISNSRRKLGIWDDTSFLTEILPFSKFKQKKSALIYRVLQWRYFFQVRLYGKKSAVKPNRDLCFGSVLQLKATGFQLSAFQMRWWMGFSPYKWPKIHGGFHWGCYGPGNKWSCFTLLGECCIFLPRSAEPTNCLDQQQDKLPCRFI